MEIVSEDTSTKLAALQFLNTAEPLITDTAGEFKFCPL
jgi:hypothetical protein